MPASVQTDIPPVRRAIGASAQLVPERTFWHLLFPLDGEESRYDLVATEGPGGQDLIEVVETPFVFTADWLGGLVVAHRRYQVVSSRHGMPPIPLPVSMQHLIEERIAGMCWEQPTLDELARAGGLHDLHLCTDESDGYPLGLYGLIMWTPRALSRIDDGEWECLSPTTWWDWQMTEPGVALEGESIQAVGLVDRGALDSIGTTRDRLPMETFARAPVMRRVQRASMWGARPRVPDSTRLASRATIPTPSQTQESAVEDSETTETTHDSLTTDDVQRMIDAAIERSAATMTEGLDELRGMIEAMGYDERSVESVTAGEPGDAEATTCTAPDPVEVAAREIETEGVAVVAAEARALVVARQLVPAQVATYIRRAIAGESVDDLIADYSGAAIMTGVPSHGEPATAPDKRSVLTESEALAQADQELPGAPAVRVTRRANEILAQAEREGRPVNRYQ